MLHTPIINYSSLMNKVNEAGDGNSDRWAKWRVRIIINRWSEAPPPMTPLCVCAAVIWRPAEGVQGVNLWVRGGGGWKLVSIILHIWRVPFNLQHIPQTLPSKSRQKLISTHGNYRVRKKGRRRRKRKKRGKRKKGGDEGRKEGKWFFPLFLFLFVCLFVFWLPVSIKISVSERKQ